MVCLGRWPVCRWPRHNSSVPVDSRDQELCRARLQETSTRISAFVGPRSGTTRGTDECLNGSWCRVGGCNNEWVGGLAWRGENRLHLYLKARQSVGLVALNVCDARKYNRSNRFAQWAYPDHVHKLWNPLAALTSIYRSYSNSRFVKGEGRIGSRTVEGGYLEMQVSRNRSCDCKGDKRRDKQDPTRVYLNERLKASWPCYPT